MQYQKADESTLQAIATASNTGDEIPVLLMTLLCVVGLGILIYYEYRHIKRKEQE